MSLNIVEFSLVFLEGLALIASPCILPILPLVLSAAVDAGKLRPYGIILGFVLSFSLFALGSATLIKITGIDLNIIKHLSFIILAILGILLMSNTLSEWFSRVTAGLATKSQQLVSQQKKGFFSGIFIGSLIGLVWTPCAGPILAAALVQIIRQESNFNSAVMILAFSLGAAIPMLIIALTGRALITSWGGLVKHASLIRKILGLLILLSVFYMASGMDLRRFLPHKEVVINKDYKGLIHPLTNPIQAPEFSGIDTWLNSGPLTIKDLKGKVVLVDFWTYSCINCIRTLPYITAWDQKYRDRGLVIVGVHAPEFEFEKDTQNVKRAIAKFGIKYPVALDNQLNTWQNFNNHSWPAHYLIDRNGKVVYTHFGEGNYEITEHNIQTLLDLTGIEPVKKERVSWSEEQTPETYLGFSRQENFASTESVAKNIVKKYDFPLTLKLHHWALKGEWLVENQRIVTKSAPAALEIHFKAKQVFLVMGNNTGKPITLSILLNGKVINSIKVGPHQLYELVNLPKMQSGTLELQINEPGLEAYAFTFGND